MIEKEEIFACSCGNEDCDCGEDCSCDTENVLTEEEVTTLKERMEEIKAEFVTAAQAGDQEKVDELTDEYNEIGDKLGINPGDSDAKTSEQLAEEKALSGMEKNRKEMVARLRTAAVDLYFADIAFGYENLINKYNLYVPCQSVQSMTIASFLTVEKKALIQVTSTDKLEDEDVIDALDAIPEDMIDGVTLTFEGLQYNYGKLAMAMYSIDYDDTGLIEMVKSVGQEIIDECVEEITTGEKSNKEYITGKDIAAERVEDKFNKEMNRASTVEYEDDIEISW